MPFNEQDTSNLKRKVERYMEVLENTKRYREIWDKSLKSSIVQHLQALIDTGGLPASIQEVAEVQNLGAVMLTLGTSASGLAEPVGNGVRRDLIKQNGSLVYQQLFNGKIVVLINTPFIEKYGQPQAPKTIAIYRPEELKEPFFQRHFETFVSDVTAWEDYDDDIFSEPNQRIGFKMNFEKEQKKQTD